MRGPDGEDPADKHVVESTGEAMIRLEIEVPKGTGGSEPELALVYSSVGGQDGPFGVGWRLPLGEIRRTTRFGTPKYDSSDRFEFEGQLLVPDDPDAPTEYRTVTETFARIRPIGESWEVRFPDGRIARFGTNAETRIRKDASTSPANDSGPIYRWLLSELEDVNGNITVFTYDRSTDPGTAYPETVSYSYRGGTSAANLVGVERRVQFVYQNRPDPILYFPGGVETHLKRRVAEIRSVAGAEAFRRMILAYSAATDPYPTHRSRLASVQVYGTDCPGSEPLPNCQTQPPRTFTYTEPYDEIADDDHWEGNSLGPPVSFVHASNDAGVRFGDVDGDGRLDLVRAWIGQVDSGSEAPTPVVYQDVWLNQGGVWALDSNWTNALQAIDPGAVRANLNLTGGFACSAGTPESQNDKIAFSFTQGVYTDFWSRTPQDAQLLDLNADGRVDIVLSVEVGAGKVDGSQCGGVAAEWAGTAVKGAWINNGSGWDYDETLSDGLPTFTSTFVRTQTGGNYLQNGAYQNAPGKCGGDFLINYGNFHSSTENHSSVWFRDNHGVRFADLNGDQRPDLIALREDARDRSFTEGAWLNTEEGWVSAPEFTPPVPLIGAFPYFADPGTGIPYERWVTDANTGVAVVDVNGDGLDDLVKTAIEPLADDDLTHGPLSSAFTSSGVWLNTGSGWCASDGGCPEAAKYLPPAGHAFTRITVAENTCVPNNPTGGSFLLHQVVGSALFYADVNGDGLLDLLQNDSDLQDGAGRHAWLQSPGQSGSLWVKDEVDGEDGPFVPPAGVEGFLWNGFKRSWQGVHFRDLDGNGTGDWIKSFDQNSFKRLSRAGHGDRIEIFANGRGGETQFGYVGATAQIDDDRETRALSDPNLGEEPPGTPGSGAPLTFWRAGPVVSEITVRSVDDEYTTSFGYGHPRWCPLHRSSLGFRLVESGLDDGTEVRSFFWQDHGRAGRVSRRETHEGGARVDLMTHDWEVVDGGDVGGSLGGVFVGRLVQETHHQEYGGSPGATRTVARGYDDTHGFNFISQIDVTRPTGNLHIARTPLDANPAEDLWLGGKVETEEATSSTGTVLRRREFGYVPGRGLRDQIKELVQPRKVPEPGDPPPEEAIAEWVYDEFGNPIKRTDPEGRETFFCYDGDTTLGADPCPGTTTATHSVLVGVLDPAEGLSELQSDLATGRVERLTEFNGDQTWMEPDAFGRPLEFWTQPATHASATLLEERLYVDDPAEDHGNTPGAVAGRPYVERFEEVGNGTDVFSAIYFDGLGREAWSVFETPATGRFGRARFRDHGGRLVRQTYEIECTGVHCTNLPGATGPAVVASYDALGRLVTLTTPDGTTVVARSRAVRTQPAGPGTMAAFDVELAQQPDGVLTRRFLDGDRVVWVEECTNQMDPPKTDPGELSCDEDPDTTFYTYEPTGETAIIYDAMAHSMWPAGYTMPQHQLVYHHDTLGRVIEINDPDGGTSFTRYDLVGNVVETTNARGQTRFFEYDELDRLWKQAEPELANPYIINYDPVTRRRQSVVSSSYYSSGYEYDDFGRLKRRTVNQLLMDFEYDLLGRLTKVRYPNTGNTAATYDYAGAYLKRVCRSQDMEQCIDGRRSWIVEDVVYDDLGRISQVLQPSMTLGLSYDPDSYRLKQQTLVGDSGNLIDLTYGYHAGGNLHTIVDAHVDKISSLDATADFAYDHRGRLKVANLLGSAREFQYDSLGNLIERDSDVPGQPNQSYLDPDKPHAITSRIVGGTTKTYDFDDDGNMTRRGSQYLSYDAAGRLICVGTSEGACDLLQNSYDLDGVRFSEITQQGTREFFEDWFVINQDDDNRVENSIYGLGRRLAVVSYPNAELRAADPIAGWLVPIDPALLGWGIVGATSLVLLGLAWRAEVSQAIRARPATSGMSMLLVGCLLPHPAWAGGSPPPGPGDVVRLYYQDHLGTDLLVADWTGTVISRRVYEPFGRLEAEGVEVQGSLDPPSETSSGRFTGQRVESMTGLYDFKARWYDPDTGRFLSVDPVLQGLADPQTHNAYGYVRNNPMNFTDPTGAFLFGGELALLGVVIDVIVISLSATAGTGGFSGGLGPPAPSTTTPPINPFSTSQPTTAEGPTGPATGAGGGNAGVDFRRSLRQLAKLLATGDDSKSQSGRPDGGPEILEPGRDPRVVPGVDLFPGDEIIVEGAATRQNPDFPRDDIRQGVPVLVEVRDSATGDLVSSRLDRLGLPPPRNPRPIPPADQIRVPVPRAGRFDIRIFNIPTPGLPDFNDSPILHRVILPGRQI